MRGEEGKRVSGRMRVLAVGLIVMGNGLEALAQTTTEEAPMAFEMTSSAFPSGQAIPAQYTCDGEDISPPLSWNAPPSGTKTFALISDDPDAPSGRWVHWVVYNLPASVRQLDEAFPTDPELPDGTKQGTTDFGRTGYGGPCPPSGTHRYFFKLYALERSLPLGLDATAREVEEAMAGHILAQAQLMGTYRRKRS